MRIVQIVHKGTIEDLQMWFAGLEWLLLLACLCGPMGYCTMYCRSRQSRQQMSGLDKRGPEERE